MDSPALADCLGVSMSDEVVVLAGEDPQSVEGQDSAKTGCSSVAAKQWSRFSTSRWLCGLRVCECGLDRWFERTGLKVCKRTKKVTDTFVMTLGKQDKNQMCLAVCVKFTLKHTVLFFFFDRDSLRDGW